MRIKAKTSFCGILTMGKGEIREYSNESVLADLFAADYIEKVQVEENISGDTDNTQDKKESVKKRSKSNESE